MYPMIDEYEFDDEFDDEEEAEQEWDEWGPPDAGTSAEWSTDSFGPFDETTEMELAAELLNIEDDDELEQFLGSLAKKAVRGVKKFGRSSVGRALTGKLRGLARKALPWAGRAVGGYFGGPAGAAIGGRLAPGIGRFFGLELEGLSPEDQEFEVARSFVRLAGDAAQQAARAPASMSPDAAASNAIRIAAKKHAPGLATGASRSSSNGRWVRRGRNIVLLNA